MRKNVLLITAFVCAAVLAGGAVGFAVGLHQLGTPDTPVLGGPLCMFGADPDSDQRSIGNDEGKLVSRVTMNKPCQGPVLGQFTTELWATVNKTRAITGFVATCIGTGGFSNPCTVGQTVDPDPEEMWLAHNIRAEDPETGENQTESRSASAVWRDLRPGRWRFDAFVAGDGPNDEASLRVGWRVFHVEAAFISDSTRG